VTALSDPRHFTAAKLAWQARVIVNPDLGQLARLRACHLTHMFGKSHTTWPAQETLARALSVTVRSIRRATEELVKAPATKCEQRKRRSWVTFCDVAPLLVQRNEESPEAAKTHSERKRGGVEKDTWSRDGQISAEFAADTELLVLVGF